MAQQTLNTPRETTHQRIADALEDIVDKIVDTSSASNIDYDNTQSGLSADKVQGAVDELASEKVDKVAGKGLSTEDYTAEEKTKLAGIEAGAQVNTVTSVAGKTGAVSLVKGDVGLGSVDNTADLNKPISRYTQGALDEKTDISNFNGITQELELFNTYDLTKDVEISVFANDTYKRDKYDRSYETHIPNLDGEYSVSLGDKTFTETCTFTIANEGKSITEVFHTNRKYILGAKLLKAENDEVGFAHVIADVVTLLISKDAPYTTTFDTTFKKPPATGVLTLKVSVKPDEKYVNTENTGGPSEYAYWGSYNGSDLLINNPILTYSETTFGQPKVSGNPITINDAAEANLVECVAKVEAVQDLHGYDHPWVGGAGKNKFPIATATSSGTQNIFTAQTVSLKANTNYVLSFDSATPTTKDMSLSFNSGDTQVRGITISAGVTSVNLTFSQNINNIDWYVREAVNLSNIMIEEGTTATSYESYSNICPISGWDECKVGVSGVNIWDEQTELGIYDQTTGEKQNYTGSSRSVNKIRIEGGTQYYLKLGQGLSHVRVFYYTANSYISTIPLVSGLFTPPNNAEYMTFQFSGTTYNHDISINYPSTDTEYHAYKGKTYTIDLDGTRYGGTLDVVSGVLTVIWEAVSLGNINYSKSQSGLFQTNEIASAVKKSSYSYAPTGYIKSSHFREIDSASITGPQGSNPSPDGVMAVNGSGVIYINYLAVTDVTDFKTAMANATLIYELATPTTIQLTPQQIRLLKGTNNISCNTGDLTIKYYPDNVLGQLKGDIENEYDARLERLEQYTDVFGFIEDMDVLSPTERIKYIGKNENYEPLTVDLNTGSYTLGDWGNFPFLVDNKPYMVKPDGTPDYQLNEYDYTKKLDGTDSDVANKDYDGGAFSWGRKIYKKQWMVGNKRHVLFSFDKKDGFHADGFINKDGKELDGRWIPMFYGTVVDGKAKSIATGNCISGGNITTDAQHNAIVAFDSDANFFGGAFVETLIDLLMMFAKNSDLQAAYGYGNSSGYVNDSSKNYGMLNNAVVNGGQFYGRSGGKTLNKALHSIVLATYNSYMRDPYEVIKNGKVVVSEDYTYDPTGATYTDTGITVPNQSSNAWRYPKKYIAVPRYGSIPDISVGGASTSLGRTDGTYTLANQSGAVIVCLRFGGCGNGALAGLSCRDWNAAASSTWWPFGFALLLDGSVVA